MSDYLDLDGAFINSLVGEGTRFDGEISLKGLLRIDGDFRGAVNAADKVLIGSKGRAECSIKAGTVVVGGILKGDIHAEDKVVVLSSGMVIGNISTPRLVVEAGVILNGECTVLGERMGQVTDHRNGTAKRGDEKDLNRYNPVKQDQRTSVGGTVGVWRR
jgi:cytoskeletal protein CcmA (bactofilin family)